MSGVLYFDGNCGMCTRSVNSLLRIQRTGELRTAPFQRAGVAERLELSTDRMESMRLVCDVGAGMLDGVIE